MSLDDVFRLPGERKPPSVKAAASFISARTGGGILQEETDIPDRFIRYLAAVIMPVG